MAVVAAASAACAVALRRPAAVPLLRHRLSLPASPSRVHGPAWFALAGGGVMLLVTSVGPPPTMVLNALTAALVAAFVVRCWRQDRSRRAADAVRLCVRESIGLMAAQLRAGLLPYRVLASLADDFPHLRSAARAAVLGGDVAGAMRRESDRPGAEALADLAGAWHVAERTGAPLSVVLDRLDAAVQDADENRREISVGAAPARATGRLMAALPAVGLVLGSGSGGDPVAVLTGTFAGAACLALGAALACAGVAWIDAIASSAERGP